MTSLADRKYRLTLLGSVFVLSMAMVSHGVLITFKLDGSSKNLGKNETKTKDGLTVKIGAGNNGNLKRTSGGLGNSAKSTYKNLVNKRENISFDVTSITGHGAGAQAVLQQITLVPRGNYGSGALGFTMKVGSGAWMAQTAVGSNNKIWTGHVPADEVIKIRARDNDSKRFKIKRVKFHVGETKAVPATGSTLAMLLISVLGIGGVSRRVKP